MQLKPECIPCILTMTISSLRRLDIDDIAVENILSDTLKLPGLKGEAWHQTSPDVIEVIMKKINHAIGNNDPFRDEKHKLNQRVTEMLPFFENLIKETPDPFYSTVKLAILGNAIDFMMPEGTAGIEKYIEEKMALSLSRQAYEAFCDKLSKSHSIAYFTDNCGEIVLDRLLINLIKKLYNADVTVIVRHCPTLNDATLKEAQEIGLDKIANVIDNGIDGPLPGTIIKRCSKRVQHLVEACDLIISKGGGNFDSLSEQLDSLPADITFLLLSKCRPINTFFQTSLHQPIIANYYKETI